MTAHSSIHGWQNTDSGAFVCPPSESRLAAKEKTKQQADLFSRVEILERALKDAECRISELEEKHNHV